MMKKTISILTTAAIFAAITVPVTAANDKLTANDVKELLCANGLQNHSELLKRSVALWISELSGTFTKTKIDLSILKLCK